MSEFLASCPIARTGHICATSSCGCLSSVEYLQKSEHLQEQLKELRSEIEVLKVEEKQSHLDEIHDQNVLQGNGKYATIGRVRHFSYFFSRFVSIYGCC